MTDNRIPSAEPLTRTCRCCGQSLDIRHFSMVRGIYRRRMCNHCRWVMTIRPSRKRAALKAVNEHAKRIRATDYEELF